MAIKKTLSVFLIASMALCLFLGCLDTGKSESIPKPSVPEFTVEVVDHSYVVPATTSIDPYTGQQIINPSYTVQNITIDITIKNQPFVQPDDLTYLCYNIREKGYFEDNWRNSTTLQIKPTIMHY